MRKNSQYISISEYCKANGFKSTKFYETLSRHPELAKKLKTNAKGERVHDEKAITAAGAILRKENRAKQGRSSASSAADEINILAAKNEVLRNEMSNLILGQALTPCIALTALQGVHHLLFSDEPEFFSPISRSCFSIADCFARMALTLS